MIMFEHGDGHMTKMPLYGINPSKALLELLFCFVLILVLRPGKQFFSHVETEPPIPGYYQYFWGVNVSCSRRQHTDPAEDRTRVS